jgi:thymidylate kinase
VGTFHALLVEGIPGIGKSTLVDALVRRHVSTAQPRKIRTLVHLAQTHTYGPLAAREDAGTLAVRDNVAHLERIAMLLEWLHAGVQHPRHPSCYVLIDTLHLTHCLRPGIVRWADVEDVDRRFAVIGCKLLVLSAGDQVVRERTIDARRETQFLSEYARKFGRTADELHAHFMREGEVFAELYDRSAMPKLMLSNDGALGDVLDEVDSFWRATER